jgi:hypothetical protein
MRCAKLILFFFWHLTSAGWLMLCQPGSNHGGAMFMQRWSRAKPTEKCLDHLKHAICCISVMRLEAADANLTLPGQHRKEAEMDIVCLKLNGYLQGWRAVAIEPSHFLAPS